MLTITQTGIVPKDAPKTGIHTDKISYSKAVDQNIYVKIFGNVGDVPKGDTLNLSVSGPDGIVHYSTTHVTTNGQFVTYFVLDRSSVIGKYG
jgi:hypothetical protein